MCILIHTCIHECLYAHVQGSIDRLFVYSMPFVEKSFVYRKQGEDSAVSFVERDF